MSDQIYSHLLLCQTLCFAHGKTPSDKVSEKSKFLSSLALLLSGDSSCTAVSVHLAQKTVLIARNDPISNEDHRYFDRFFGMLRVYSNTCFDPGNTATSADAEKILRSLIYQYNAKKIIKRFISRNGKVIDRLQKFIHLKPDPTPFIDELRSNSRLYREKPAMTEKCELILANQTDQAYVQCLFRMIERFLLAYDQLIKNRTNPTDEDIDRVSRLAVLLYQSRLFLFMIRSLDEVVADGAYYFEKISAHVRSLNLILKCLFRRRNDLGEIYKQITWKLIPLIEQEVLLDVIPKRAFEMIFNDCSLASSSTVVERLTADDFYLEHLTKMNVHDQHGRVSMHVHAEILLIDYLLNNGINENNHSKDVEIGISKLPCLLCSYYVNELNNKYSRCFFSSQFSNGKIYGKWLLRNSEDASIIRSIDDKLIDKLKQAIRKLELHSDRSGPKKSGDSDAMFTSIEEDQFDQRFCDEVMSIGL